MPELTEGSPEVVLAAQLLAAWYDGDNGYGLERARNTPVSARNLVAAARRLAAEGKLGPVAQPEPETWEPTVRLRWNGDDGPLQQIWRSSSGAEEWRDVEAEGGE